MWLHFGQLLETIGNFLLQHPVILFTAIFNYLSFQKSVSNNIFLRLAEPK